MSGRASGDAQALHADAQAGPCRNVSDWLTMFGHLKLQVVRVAPHVECAMQEITSDHSGIWIFIVSALVGLCTIGALILRAVAAA